MKFGKRKVRLALIERVVELRQKTFDKMSFKAGVFPCKVLFRQKRYILNGLDGMAYNRLRPVIFWKRARCGVEL